MRRPRVLVITFVAASGLLTSHGHAQGEAPSGAESQALAQAAFEQGNFGDALQYAIYACEGGAGAEARLLLARAYLGVDPTNVYDAFEQLKAIRETGVYQANRAFCDDVARRFVAELRHVIEAEREGGRDPGYYRHQEAEALVFLGELDAAFAIYDESVAQEPTDSAFLARALAWRARGDLEKAAADLRQALALCSTPVEAETELYALHRSRDDLASLIRDATAVLERFPDDELALVERSAAHLAQGDREQAGADFLELARIQPFDLAVRDQLRAFGLPLVVPSTACLALRAPHARHRKREIYEAQHFAELAATLEQEERLADALVAWRNVVAADKDDHDSWMKLGALEERMGNLDGALTAYEGACRCRYRDTSEAIVKRSITTQRVHDAARAPLDAKLALDARDYDALMARGALLLRHGKHDEARADFEAAASIRPAAPEPWFSQGDVRYAEEKYDEAAELYTKALDLDPDARAIVQRRWNAWLAAASPAMIDDCEQRIAREPQDADLYYARAQANYALRKDLDAAIADCQRSRALDGDPDMRCIRLLRRIHLEREEWDAAMEDLWAQIEQDPADMELRWLQAEVHERKGELDAAVREYEYALYLDPQEGETLDRLSSLYRRRGMVTEAIGAWRKLIECFPEDGESQEFLAEYMAEQGRYEEAIVQYQVALTHAEMEVTRRMAWMGLGNAYGMIGRHIEAAEAYGRYLELDASASMVREWRWTALRAGGRAEQAEAEMAARIASFPEDGDAHSARGRMRLEQGDYSGASMDFQRLLELRPDSWDALTGLADARLFARDYEGAVPLYERALALQPDNVAARRNLGVCHFFQTTSDGRWLAIADFKRCLELDPADERSHRGYIHASRSVGDYGPIQDYFGARIEESPDDTGLRMERAEVLFDLGRKGASEVLQRAIADARAVVALEPQNERAWDIICMSYDELLDYDSAESAFRQARARNPMYLSPSLLKSFGAKVDREEGERRAAGERARKEQEEAEMARRRAEQEAQAKLSETTRAMPTHGFWDEATHDAAFANLAAGQRLQMRINADLDFARQRREVEERSGGRYTLTQSKPW